MVSPAKQLVGSVMGYNSQPVQFSVWEPKSGQTIGVFPRNCFWKCTLHPRWSIFTSSQENHFLYLLVVQSFFRFLRIFNRRYHCEYFCESTDCDPVGSKFRARCYQKKWIQLQKITGFAFFKNRNSKSRAFFIQSDFFWSQPSEAVSSKSDQHTRQNKHDPASQKPIEATNFPPARPCV